MADQKFFLDLGGLRTLWGKITNTFATKTDVDTKVETINNNIGEVASSLEVLSTDIDNRIDGIDVTIAAMAPREYDYYNTAVADSVSLSPGTILKIKNDTTIEEDNVTYRAGLYIVVSAGVIERVSTASGSGAGENIEDIAELVNELNSKAITNVVISDENNTPLNSVEKSGNDLIIKVDNTFNVNTDSVNALTHRAIAAMYGDLVGLISSVPKFKVEIVEELPDLAGEVSLTTIYLKKNVGDNTEYNLYTEFICVEKVVEGVKTYVWEKLGEQTLNIDNLASKSYVEGMIAAAMQNVALKSDVETAVNTAKAEILDTVADTYVSKTDADKYVDNDSLAASLSNYYTKSDADNTFLTSVQADAVYAKTVDLVDLVTEAEILASISTGLIGEAVKITDDQINSLPLI